MKKNNLFLSTLIATTLMAPVLAPYAQAIQIPKPEAFSNKMVDAWDGTRLSSEITGVAVDEMLPMDPEREAKYNFERAARWEINQVEFFEKSYAYVIKNGIDPRATRGQKILGYTSLATGYNYHVEPAFHDGLYTRSDRYFVRPELSAEGTFKKLDDAAIKGSNAFNYNIEYSFYRHFADPKLAVLSAPYFYKNLPFNASRAIDGLKVGDLFRFKARLNILVDSTYFSDVATSKLGVSAGLYFLLTGGFEVHVMRMEDNHVRLKIVGLRKQSGGGKLEVGYGSDLDIVGLEIIDNKILSIVDTKVIQAQLEKSLDRSFLADYVMDLNKPEVATAYDKALAQARDFNYLKVVDPRNKPQEVSKEVLSNVTAIEDAMKAAQAGGDHKSIIRLFHGNNKVNSTDWKIKLGNNILNVKAGGYNATTRTTSLKDDGNSQSYILENHQKQTSFHFFYSLFNVDRQRNAGVVSSANDSFQQTDAQSFVMSFQRKDKRLRDSEVDILRRQLEKSLPQYAHEIDLSALEGKTHSNSSFRSQVIITAEGLQSLPQLSEKEMTAAYLAHLDGLKVKALSDFEVQNNSRQLAKVASSATSLNEKTKILSELRSNRLFKTTGAGFLISLIPSEKVDSTVRVDISISASGAELVEYSKGPQGPASLYAQLLQNEAVTKDDHYELRLESESLKAKDN